MSHATSGGIVPQKGCYNVRISQCLLEANNLDGIAPESCRKLLIEKCQFRRNKKAALSFSCGHYEEYHIDGVKFKKDVSKHFIQSIEVVACRFETEGDFAVYANKLHNTIFKACRFEGSQFSFNNEIIKKADPRVEIKQCTNIQFIDCEFVTVLFVPHFTVVVDKIAKNFTKEGKVAQLELDKV